MSQEHIEVVRRFLDARDRGDLLAALTYLDPNVEVIPLRAATEGGYRGHEGVEMDIPSAGILEFREGKIIRWQDFGSKDKALEAVGLSE